jgi:hypothetical protein
LNLLSALSGGVVLKSIWETLPFVIGVLVASLIVCWWAWSVLGFLMADAPVVVVHP